MNSLFVGFRIDGDGRDAQLAAGANDADGNLAAIGDQDFVETFPVMSDGINYLFIIPLFFFFFFFIFSFFYFSPIVSRKNFFFKKGPLGLFVFLKKKFLMGGFFKRRVILNFNNF